MLYFMELKQFPKWFVVAGLIELALFPSKYRKTIKSILSSIVRCASAAKFLKSSEIEAISEKDILEELLLIKPRGNNIMSVCGARLFNCEKSRILRSCF
jgi:hypothetical protein